MGKISLSKGSEVKPRYDQIVEKAIERVGKRIVLAAPLALGKPNQLINAFYDRAKNDPSIHLVITSALTLERPKGQSLLEKRFLIPMAARVFGDYPDLSYECDRMAGALPMNVEIIEFYYPPGKFMGNSLAQQNYISTNFTHVARDLADRGINVIVQMVARKMVAGLPHLSLSSNADVTLDLMDLLRKEGRPLISIAQVNQNLPFMYGDALIEESVFDELIDEKKAYHHLFSPPKMPVSDQDFMVGLHASALIKDDGELQVGIGSLGDALIYSLLLRHQHNAEYTQLHAQLLSEQKYGPIIERIGGMDVFEQGLFGATEMMVDGYQHLYQAKILKKKAYGHIGLQRLLNSGEIKEKYDNDIIEVLIKHGLIKRKITREDFKFLEYWGIIREGLRFCDGNIVLEDESVASVDSREALGVSLRRGHVVHAGFFLGPQSFYDWLRALPENERALFAMKSVQKINQLYGHEDLDRLHRKNARFVNSCLMTTLLGSHVSDGLEDGRVISGVGGQFNFVAMAQELPDGHSVIKMRSTRTKINGQVVSNIVDKYGHITIPRHMRDILVTEYGVAFLRGKTDQEIVVELLKVCDSRFQEELANSAKRMGKLNVDFQIPEVYRNNLPQHYQSILLSFKERGLFERFPFGTDFTAEELIIAQALKSLKKDLQSGPAGKWRLIKGIWQESIARKKARGSLMARMNLEQPKGLKEKIYATLLGSRLPR